MAGWIEGKHSCATERQAPRFGAVCTSDGGKLSGGVELTISTLPHPPLTATVHDVPSSHDGSAAFIFELPLSENIEGFSYTTLQQHALTVTGGTLSKVRRLEPGKGETCGNGSFGLLGADDLAMEDVGCGRRWRSPG